MATYKEITEWIKYNHGYIMDDAWVTEVKRKKGIKIRKIKKSGSKTGSKTKKSHCPPHKEKYIVAALKHFKMIK